MGIVKDELVNKRYKVIEAIKSGGMGAVYKALDLHFKEKEVALKEMLQDFSSDETIELVRRKFEEEANILVRLHHQGIPGVSDFFTEKNLNYIVMDYIDGENLDTVLKEYLTLTGKPVPEIPMVLYAIQICEILEYLHNQQPLPIIHRDIKPGNIILKKLSNEVVLVDFGLARSIDSESQSTKTLVGTVGYAPLEQFKGHPEPRSDIYSLGATMHHMLSGKRPTPLEIEPLESAYPEIDRELAKVVNKAINEAPKDRFGSALEMKKALQEVHLHLQEREYLQSARESRDRAIEGDYEYPTRRFTKRAPQAEKLPETYLDESLDQKLKRYDKEGLDIRESPFWKESWFHALVFLAFIVGIISVGAAFYRYSRKMAPYIVFESGARKTAARDWMFLEGSRYCIDKSAQTIVLGKVAKQEGFILERKENNGKPIEKVKFDLRIKHNPTLKFIFDAHAIQLIDVKNVFSNSQDDAKVSAPSGERYSVSLIKKTTNDIDRTFKLNLLAFDQSKVIGKQKRDTLPEFSVERRCEIIFSSPITLSIDGELTLEGIIQPQPFRYFGIIFDSAEQLNRTDSATIRNLIIK